eukprot:9002324-Lingulodinium_polyedra.AAC.1
MDPVQCRHSSAKGARCEAIADILGDRAILCQVGAWVDQRHIELKRMVAAWAKAAGFMVHLEQVIPHLAKPGNPAVFDVWGCPKPGNQA